MLSAGRNLSRHKWYSRWHQVKRWFILLPLVVVSVIWAALGSAGPKEEQPYPFVGYGRIPVKDKTTLTLHEPRPWWDNEVIGNAYERARLSDVHIDSAKKGIQDSACLACHQEIFDAEGAVLAAIDPAIDLSKLKPWYQDVTTYQGPQLRFHYRHLKTPLATSIMDLSCVFCHENTEVRATYPGEDSGGSFRKQVSGETCLLCHGQFPQAHRMSWPALQTAVGGQDCLACHNAETLRNVVKKVDYLQADKIVAQGQDNAALCYGCHGGRAWYQKAVDHQQLRMKRYTSKGR